MRVFGTCGELGWDGRKGLVTGGGEGWSMTLLLWWRTGDSLWGLEVEYKNGGILCLVVYFFLYFETEALKRIDNLKRITVRDSLL